MQAVCPKPVRPYPAEDVLPEVAIDWYTPDESAPRCEHFELAEESWFTYAYLIRAIYRLRELPPEQRYNALLRIILHEALSAFKTYMANGGRKYKYCQRDIIRIMRDLSK